LSSAPQVTNSSNGLTFTAYPGDGDVLLAFSLDEKLLQQNDLAGFAIQWTPPGGQPQFIPNRLSFSQAMTSATTPQQRTWTSSQEAPFQKFHWVHFPPDVLPGKYTYKVTARYCQDGKLVDGPSVQISLPLVAGTQSNFELGFTRGYLTSQAYVQKFKNANIRPPLPKTLDNDTTSFQPQYEWLGYHARKMVFSLLKECVADPTITVDLFAYDIDEPDIVKMLEELGPRLRAFLDNAPLHLGKALEVQVHDRLVKSAGAQNVKQGHFKRFAHDKIIIQKKNGKATKVLTGSANFSIRGLYVQANNVMLFNDAKIADQYAQVFQSVFDNMGAFSGSALAAQVFPFPNQPGVPDFSVSFAPHKNASVSLGPIADALKNAKSSVLFAVMELGGSGDVLPALDAMHNSGKLFSYGITQSEKGFTVYKPGAPGVLVPFATLSKNVPPPFDKEWSGGMGQVIHDKFVVFDFNDANPLAFTGSSNLAAGGEMANGDNLLGFADAGVATAFAIEAFRLVDHFQFRAALQNATDVQPLQLSACGTGTKWWANDYDPAHIRNYERQLLALGAAGAGNPPAGGVNTGAGTGTGTAAPNTPSEPKVPAKKPPATKTPTKKKTTTKTSTKPKPTSKKAPAAKKPKPGPKKKSTAKPAARKTTKTKAKATKKKGTKKTTSRK